MKNKEFDAWIKSKVEQIERNADSMNLPGIPPPDWNKLSKDLDWNIIPDPLDIKVKNTLANAKVHSKDANWEHFQQRLQIVRDRRNKILKARMVELAMVLLIFWTLHTVADNNLIQLPSINKSNLVNLDTRTSFPELENLNQSKSLTTKIKSEKSNSNLLPTEKEQTLVKPNPSFTLQDNHPILQFNNNSKTTSSKSTARPTLANPTQLVQMIKSPSEDLDGNALKTEVVRDESKIGEVSSSNIVGKDKLFQDQKIISTVDSVLPTLTSERDNLEIQSVVPTEVAVQPELIDLQKTKTLGVPFLWIGIGSSFKGTHFQNSNRAPDYIKKYSGNFNSYGKSIRLILQYPLWMIELGAEFFNMNYSEQKYLAFGNLKEGESIDIIKRMEFKMLEIPFNLHYKVLDHKLFQMTAFAGMSLAICNSASYEVTSAINKKPQPLFYNPKEELTYIDVQYNNGVNKDHSFANNTYSNYSLGLGFNVPLSQHFKINSTISYQAMIGLQGFGPLNERYRNCTIGLGVQYGF